MDSERLNKWLTSFANIGVLVGLAVLVFEIRQNNELTLAQIEQTRSDTFLQWRQEMVLNDHLAPMLAKGSQYASEISDKPQDEMSALEKQKLFAASLEKFDPVERLRAVAYLTRDYWDYENLYFQYKRELVSDAYWNERIVPVIIGQAPQWKGANSGRLPRGRNEFNEEIERLLSADE